MYIQGGQNTATFSLDKTHGEAMEPHHDTVDFGHARRLDAVGGASVRERCGTSSGGR